MAGPHLEPSRTLLAYLVRQKPCTYHELARLFEGTARKLGEDPGVTITDRHLRRLASGEQAGVPHPATCRVLEAIFKRPVDELLQPPAAITPTVVEPNGPTRTSAQMPQEVLKGAAQGAFKFGLLPHATPSRDEMEIVYEEVWQLARLYSRRPVLQLVTRLVDVQRALFVMLEARQVPKHAQQLYFLAGVTGGILARASHDLADTSAAMTQARTAFTCADRADHNGLRAWVRALQSMIAYWDDQPQKAIDFAQAGRAIEGRSTTRIWLPVMEARARARLGDAGTSRRLIEDAERERDRAQKDDLDEMGGICNFGPHRLDYCITNALAWLPQEAKACQRYAERAIDGYQDTSAHDWSFSFQAGSRADLAIGRICAGDPDGAVEALALVLEIPPELRTNLIIQSMQHVQTVLTAAPPAASSRMLADEIKAFTSTAQRALAGPQEPPDSTAREREEHEPPTTLVSANFR